MNFAGKSFNYHLFTETEGNSDFCGPKAAATTSGRGATKVTVFPRSQ